MKVCKATITNTNNTLRNNITSQSRVCPFRMLNRMQVTMLGKNFRATVLTSPISNKWLVSINKCRFSNSLNLLIRALSRIGHNQILITLTHRIKSSSFRKMERTPPILKISNSVGISLVKANQRSLLNQISVKNSFRQSTTKITMFTSKLTNWSSSCSQSVWRMFCLFSKRKVSLKLKI